MACILAARAPCSSAYGTIGSLGRCEVLALAWDELSAAELAPRLGDGRFAVRERAVQQLARRGTDAVPILRATLQNAAQAAFTHQNVNGILIFVARDDRRDIIVPDRAGAQAGWFTPDVLRSIRTSMEAQFRSESYDAGITGAVDAILNVYRAHLVSSEARRAVAKALA